MLSAWFRFIPNNIVKGQQRSLFLMAIAIVLLIPITAMASAHVTMSLGLGANQVDKVAGYRIYYKNGSSSESYNGSGLDLGNSPVEIPFSSLADTDAHMHKTIDDSSAGTASTGAWHVSSGTLPFGVQSLYSKEAGAEYTFESEKSGRNEIALWWSGYESRCSEVPIHIYDGDTLLDTVNVDQSQNSGAWNVLGTYNFDHTARVSVISASEECSTSADAVRFAFDEVTLTGLTAGETYYFVATVYDSNGNESSYSDEVIYAVPADVAPLIITYEVNAITSNNGTISPAGVTSVAEGESVTYTISASPDHHIADVLVDGVSVGALSSYTFNQIGANHNIEAFFEADQITGSIDPDIDDTANDDTANDDTINLNPNEPDFSIIIDDGDIGTSSNGSWRSSGGTEPFGKQSLYSKEVGADYAYESNLAGRYEVALWWSGYKSRCSDVPVEIYDGDMLLDTVRIDQSQNSGQWNLIGTYDFSGVARAVVVSETSDCSTAADAARFTVDEQIKIIDDGNTGTASTGAWAVSGGSDPFGAQSLYSKEIGADYLFQSPLNGYYEVAVWWSGYKSRCSNVPVEIYDGDELIDTINLDQSQNSGQWNILGSYYFNGDAKVYIVSDSNECSTCADAVKFIVDNEPKVIDNGDTGTSSTGEWSVSGGADPFGEQSLYSREVGADYTYESQIIGLHEVALWWSGYKSRCSDVPVDIYDGDILLDRVYVDQSKNSGHWNVLGAYEFSKEAKVTIISQSNACSTAADALKLSK
jgi:DNA/RNA-binding domain of Phe-tRNA-synthetase-like protein